MPTGRGRMIMFIQWVGTDSVLLSLLLVSLIMMGGEAMIGNLALHAFVSVWATAGNRVEGSTSPLSGRPSAPSAR